MLRWITGASTAGGWWLEVLLEPQSEAAEEPARALGGGGSRTRDLGGLGRREMQETRAGRERGTLRRLGEAGDLQRPADADLLVEDEPGELARAGELAGAAGEDDAAPGELVEAALLEPLADELESFFETRSDNADEKRLRHVIGRAVLFLADLRHRDRLALVGRRA